jgi:hypothetical protein
MYPFERRRYWVPSGVPRRVPSRIPTAPESLPIEETAPTDA